MKARSHFLAAVVSRSSVHSSLARPFHNEPFEDLVVESNCVWSVPTIPRAGCARAELDPRRRTVLAPERTRLHPQFSCVSPYFQRLHLTLIIHPSFYLPLLPSPPPFQITMRPKHRAELNALMALATPPAVSTGGDRSSIGGDNFYLPLMSLSSSRPEWPQNGVDYDSDDGDTRPRALSLAGVPEIIQRRICFFLNVPSARNLAITCSGLRDCAEERIWETVDIHRLMK